MLPYGTMYWYSSVVPSLTILKKAFSYSIAEAGHVYENNDMWYISVHHDIEKQSRDYRSGAISTLYKHLEIRYIECSEYVFLQALKSQL